MKTIKEIINDLVEFAEANGVIGDGSVYISVGNLQINLTVPVDGDKETPTVEAVTKNMSKAEAARRRFMGCGLVEGADETSFDKVFNSDVDEDMVKSAIKDADNVEV